jgi:hypothetical protein
MGAPARKHKPTKTRERDIADRIRQLLRREMKTTPTQLARRRPTALDGDVIDADLVRAMPFAHGATKSIFTPEQQRILGEPAKDHELDVRPDNGAVYMPHVHVRRRLDRAFDIGGWRLLPAPGPEGALQKQSGRRSDTIFQKQQLWVGNYAAPVAEAFGFAKYYPNNPAMDYGDAIEALASNALTRCGKRFGIGNLIGWDKRQQAEWRRAHCKVVIVASGREGKPKAAWVRKDIDEHDLRALKYLREAKPDEYVQVSGRAHDEDDGYAPPQRRSEQTSAQTPPGEAKPPTDPATPQIFVDIRYVGEGKSDRGPWKRYVVHTLHAEGRAEYAAFDPPFSETRIKTYINERVPCLLKWEVREKGLKLIEAKAIGEPPKKGGSKAQQPMLGANDINWNARG